MLIMINNSLFMNSYDQMFAILRFCPLFALYDHIWSFLGTSDDLRGMKCMKH